MGKIFAVRRSESISPPSAPFCHFRIGARFSRFRSPGKISHAFFTFFPHPPPTDEHREFGPPEKLIFRLVHSLNKVNFWNGYDVSLPVLPAESFRPGLPPKPGPWTRRISGSLSSLDPLFRPLKSPALSEIFCAVHAKTPPFLQAHSPLRSTRLTGKP